MDRFQAEPETGPVVYEAIGAKAPSLPRRLGWGWLGLGLVLLLAAWPGLLAGVEDYSGQVIRDIQYTGTRGLAEDTLGFYLGIEVGETLDQTELNANIKRLWETDLVDDLQVEAVPVEDGVRILVRVVERPTLVSVEYEGLKKVSRSDVEDRISKDRIRLYEGDPLRLGELHRLQAAIEDLYREKGYRFTQVEFRREPAGPGEERVWFTIDEGDRLHISDIKFEGNEVFGDRRLRWAMKKTKEKGLLTLLNKKDVYNPANLQEDLGSVKDLYRSAGYKNVVLGDPQLTVQGGQDEKRRLVITIPVDEGQRFRFGEITIEGNEVYADERLMRAFTHKPGSWLRSKVLDEAVKNITEAYRNTGYINAQVRTELRDREGQVADVIVRVDEGEQFKVGRIEFTGNSRTRDKVLRREMRVQEGYVLNMKGVENSILKINQLGYFKLNEEEPVKIGQVDNEKNSVDLIFNGEESDRTELQFGGGFSELDGFFGQFGIRTRNFLGRGESLGLSAQVGRFRNFFDVSYFIPWFLDKPQSIGIQAFSNQLDFDLLTGQRFERKTSGGIVTYGRSFGLFHNAAVSYNRSTIDDRQTLINLDGQLVTQELSLENSSVRLNYVFDSRNHPFETTFGRRFSASVEYAGGPLGGTNWFVRPMASFSYFRPVSTGRLPTVLAFNAEGGLVTPFGGRELSFLERFFLGGENSIRGFRFRSIWARDENGNTIRDQFGFPRGGDRFLQFNLEYRFQLSGPFMVLAFVDAGSVFDEDQDIDLSHLRTSAGLEMRINVPLFGAPLRFIYARNLDPLPDDRFESFQFSIGTSF